MRFLFKAINIYRSEVDLKVHAMNDNLLYLIDHW